MGRLCMSKRFERCERAMPDEQYVNNDGSKFYYAVSVEALLERQERELLSVKREAHGDGVLMGRKERAPQADGADVFKAEDFGDYRELTPYGAAYLANEVLKKRSVVVWEVETPGRNPTWHEFKQTTYDK